MAKFREHLTQTLRLHMESEEFRYTDNSPEYYARRSAEAMEKDRLFLAGFAGKPYEKQDPDFAEFIRAEVELKQNLYDMLADEYSRNLLVLLAVYDLLGHRFVKFPYYRPDNIERREALHSAAQASDPNQEVAEKARKNEFGVGYAAHYYDAAAVGRDFRFYSTAEFLLGLSRTPQYVYAHGNALIRVEQGDYVLDCGACMGDTAIMFADDAGPEGRVFAFEAHPLISVLFRYNAGINERLRDRIALIPKAVSSSPDGKLSFALQGAGSSYVADVVAKESPIISVQTTSIDREVAERGLSRLDFIKMDIEGAELEALRGAEETLKKFRPKLAVCLYHSPRDFFTIPALLEDMDLGYSFYLDHHAVNDWETVLYALP